MQVISCWATKGAHSRQSQPKKKDPMMPARLEVNSAEKQ